MQKLQELPLKWKNFFYRAMYIEQEMKQQFLCLNGSLVVPKLKYMLHYYEVLIFTGPSTILT